MIPWIARYLESLRARRAVLPTLYFALLLGITAFFIGRWPVVAYDIYPYGGALSYVTSATLLVPTPAWSTARSLATTRRRHPAP